MGNCLSDKSKPKDNLMKIYQHDNYVWELKDLILRTVSWKIHDIELDYWYVEILGSGSFGEVWKA